MSIKSEDTDSVKSTAGHYKIVRHGVEITVSKDEYKKILKQEEIDRKMEENEIGGNVGKKDFD